MQNNIEQQINSELEKFKNEVYNGKVEIPSNILDLFRRGILALAPQSHGILASKLKALYTRKISEITNGELSDIIKIIVNTPFGKMYKNKLYAEDRKYMTLPSSVQSNFESVLDSHIKFERFILAYNQHINDFQEKLKAKKATLQALSKGVQGNRLHRVIN